MKKYAIILGLLFSIPVLAQEVQEENLIGTLIIPPEQPVLRIEEDEKILLLNYTWADFLQNKSCQDDFNQLQQLPFLSSEQQSLKDKMQTYCVGKIGAWDSLLTLFRQNKKALLIDKALQEKSTFMGYIKALPYYLFDIHNTQATGSTLFAKLDKIQKAISAKNPEAVVLLMQDLSPKEQLFFISLFNEANALIDFKVALQGGTQ